jgi:acetyl esterase/lipase
MRCGWLWVALMLMPVAQAQHAATVPAGPIQAHDNARASGALHDTNGAAAPRDDYAPTPPVLYPGGVRSFRDVIFAQPLGYRPLTLDLYLPADGPAKKPVVVFIHGGAWRSRTARDGGAFRDFPAVLASVAARGYVVASVNYRFSAEARFPAPVQDVALAIRWLRGHSDSYGIDTNKFVAWGSSAGGQIAALLGTACGVSAFEPPAVGDDTASRSGKASAAGGARAAVEPSICVQGVIDWYGLVDLESDGKDLGKPDVPDYVNTYLGCKLSDCAAGWARSASPFPYIDAKDPPFLIQHGAADTTVSPAQSKRLYEALHSAGVTAELVIYPGVAHGFAKVPGGSPDDAINKQAMDKVFEYLGHYFPTDRRM